MIKGDYSLFSYMIPVEEVGVGGIWMSNKV